MPPVTMYVPGDPCWADLGSPDLRRSRDFYCELFGWSSYTLIIADLGEYEMFSLGGTQGPQVAGMQALADDTQPSSWSCTVRTDDLEVASRNVLAAGGHALVEPTVIANLGRLAVFADTQGANFSLWQAYDLQGAGVTDEPSALCWIELCCEDTELARRFYGEIFGWKAVDRIYQRWSAVDRRRHPSVYTDWMLGDRPLAGMFPVQELWPERRPNQWIPYFWVDDCDASIARAVDLGAEVEIAPDDVEYGRFGIVVDPVGARFGLFAPSQAVIEDVRTRPRHMTPQHGTPPPAR